MEHKHSVYDTDPHFIVDEHTRVITYQGDTLPQIVQGDHNSEKFTFQLPKVVDGHDLTLCNKVRVHYINVDSSTKDTSKDFYPVKELVVLESDETKIALVWSVTGNATKYAGKLNFMLKFLCEDDDGNITYSWNTLTNGDLTVGNGMDNSDAATADPYPDIIAQWEASLFGIGDTEEQRLFDVSAEQQAAIAAEGQKQIDAIAGKGAAVLDSIPDEYEYVSALADQNHRNKAGAIVLDAEGESMVLKDASEYPLMGLKVFGKSEQFKTTGKNLLSTEEAVFTTRNGIEYTAKYDQFGNLEYISATGTATDLSYCVIAKSMNLPVGDYILSGCPVGGGADLYDVRFNGVTGRDFGDGLNFTITDETTQGSITCVVASGVSVTDLRFTPMIRLATVGDSTYEPYTGGVASPSPEYPQEIHSVENAVVSVYGKNLINVPDFDSTNYSNIIVRDEVAAKLPIGASIIVDYEYSGDGTPNASTNYTVGVAYVGASATVYKHKGESFIIESAVERINIYGDVTGSATTGRFSNIILRLADATEGFEPYKEKQTVTIPHTLPGIPVSSGGNYTDANGQQWICDVTDFEKGVNVSHFDEIILTGEENWNQSDSYENVYELSRNNIAWKTICSHYPHAQTDGMAGDYAVISNYTRNVRIKDVRFVNDLDGFKTWLALQYANETPVVLLRELTEPIETPLSDAEITAYKALCTNKPNTTILNDAGAYMAVEYVADTKTYIDNKIAELMAQ